MSKKLWLWKNFVDGRPEYWAFDNPYPCQPNGDPITLGEPCGYAIVKESVQGRTDVPEANVISAIKRATQRPEALPTSFENWLGNQSHVMRHQAALEHLDYGRYYDSDQMRAAWEAGRQSMNDGPSK